MQSSELKSSARVSLIAGLLGCAALAVLAATAIAQNASKSPATKAGRIPDAEIRKNVDREWVRKALVNDLLDHWV